MDNNTKDSLPFDKLWKGIAVWIKEQNYVPTENEKKWMRSVAVQQLKWGGVGGLLGAAVTYPLLRKFMPNSNPVAKIMIVSVVACASSWYPASMTLGTSFESLLKLPDSPLGDVAFKELNTIKPNHPWITKHYRDVSKGALQLHHDNFEERKKAILEHTKKTD